MGRFILLAIVALLLLLSVGGIILARAVLNGWIDALRGKQ